LCFFGLNNRLPLVFKILFYFAASLWYGLATAALAEDIMKLVRCNTPYLFSFRLRCTTP